MVAQNHCLGTAHGLHQPFALIRVKRRALVVVVYLLVVKRGGKHRDRQQAVLQGGHSHAGDGVNVHEKVMEMAPGLTRELLQSKTGVTLI